MLFCGTVLLHHQGNYILIFSLRVSNSNFVLYSFFFNKTCHTKENKKIYLYNLNMLCKDKLVWTERSVRYIDESRWGSYRWICVYNMLTFINMLGQHYKKLKTVWEAGMRVRVTYTSHFVDFCHVHIVFIEILIS